MDVPHDPAARTIASTPAAMHQPIRQIDFHEAGIGAVIWATGYDLDFSWIDLPVLDEQGAPVHDKGVTQFPGLYFLGLNFLSKFSSSFLIGVAADAERLADNIARKTNGASSRDAP